MESTFAHAARLQIRVIAKRIEKERKAWPQIMIIIVSRDFWNRPDTPVPPTLCAHRPARPAARAAGCPSRRRRRGKVARSPSSPPPAAATSECASFCGKSVDRLWTRQQIMHSIIDRDVRIVVAFLFRMTDDYYVWKAGWVLLCVCSHLDLSVCGVAVEVLCKVMPSLRARKRRVSAPHGCFGVTPWLPLEASGGRAGSVQGPGSALPTPAFHQRSCGSCVAIRAVAAWEDDAHARGQVMRDGGPSRSGAHDHRAAGGPRLSGALGGSRVAPSCRRNRPPFRRLSLHLSAD